MMKVIGYSKIPWAMLSETYRLADAAFIRLYSSNPSPTDPVTSKYMGFTLGLWLASKIAEFISTKELKSKQKTSDLLSQWMGDINERRLYWVWGGGLLETVLSVLPDDLSNKGQAQKEVSALDPYIGCLGWALYYTRFSLNISLVLEYTFKDDPTKQTNKTQRFKRQLNERKYALINDSVWATGNLVCFFWLCGKGAKGQYGNLLNIALLAMDLTLTAMKFNDAHHQYKSDISLMSEGSERWIQRKAEWQHEKKLLTNDIAYALGLLVAFSILTIPFLPVTAPIALTLNVVGITGCFALGVIYSGVASGIDISKTKEARALNLTEMKDKISVLKQIDPRNRNEKEAKTTYQDFETLSARQTDAQAMIRYQNLNLVRSVMMDALFPALVFSATIFLPLGIGYAALGLGMGIALVSKLLIDRYAKPQTGKVVEFNQEKYKQFWKDLDNKVFDKPEKIPQLAPPLGIFSPYSSSNKKEDPLEPKSTPGKSV